MNVERCVHLHNEILQIAWTGSGRSLDRFAEETKTWFEAYGDDASSALPDLDSEVTQFLQQARVVSPQREPTFFYWVDDLAYPEFMFEFEEHFASELDFQYEGEPEKRDYEPNRYIVLYGLTHLDSHSLGLVYDQISHVGILCPIIDNVEHILLKQTPWYPLETILSYWLRTIREGQIVAVSNDRKRDIEFKHPQSFDPWIYLRFHDLMLNKTLDVYNKLLDAIEARLPRFDADELGQATHGIVDESVLQNSGLLPGFAYEFFKHARRPRFKMIAPGLELLDSSTFYKQPFLPNPDQRPSHKGHLPPILLFYSKRNYVNSDNLSTTGENHPFGYQLRHISTFPAGLYLQSTSMSRADDECDFVLPFGIGANGFARKSDGVHFGPGKRPKDSFTDLYNLGYHPFETNHSHALASVLRNWLGMVERGDWEIGEHGVTGGMETWRAADTQEDWGKYVIPHQLD